MTGHFIGSISDFDKSGGWFVGQFMAKWGHPELVTDKLEIAWKKLDTSFVEKAHYHKQILEIDIVISGQGVAKVENKEYKLTKGSFLYVPPGTIVQDFKVIKPMELLVIKAPSGVGDKIEVQNS